MRSLVLAFAAITVTAGLLPAQGRGARSGDIPPGHRPPPGLCRIWIDGVPPGRQPAPTRCSDAVRNRPANARVIHGDDSRGRERWESDGRHDRDDDDRRWDDDRRDRNGKYKGKGKHRSARSRPSGDVCLDRNRNGWCDWRETSRTTQGRRTSDRCTDRNRDGHCDFAAPPRVSTEEVLGAIFGLP